MLVKKKSTNRYNGFLSKGFISENFNQLGNMSMDSDLLQT